MHSLLERHRESGDQVDHALLLNDALELGLSALALLVILTLKRNEHPDDLSDVPGVDGNLGPKLTAFTITLIGRGCSEGNDKTQDSTQDTEQITWNCEAVARVLRYRCNH